MSRRGCRCCGEDLCPVCWSEPEDARLDDRIELTEVPPAPVTDQRRWGVHVGRGWRLRDPNTCEHLIDRNAREDEMSDEKCTHQLLPSERPARRFARLPEYGFCKVPGRLYDAQGAITFRAVLCPRHATHYRGKGYVLTPVEEAVPPAVPALTVLPGGVR